jgi:phosphatidate cytidylyltransferase
MLSISPMRPFNADLMLGVWVMLSLVFALTLATGFVKKMPRANTRGVLHAQVTSWWWLLPPVFAAWALYPIGVWVLVMLISALAARELALLTQPNRTPGLRWRLAGLWVLQGMACALDVGLSITALMLVFALVMHQVRRAGGLGSGDRSRSSSRSNTSSSERREALLLALFAVQAAGGSCLLGMTPAGTSRDVAAAWFLYLCVVTALNDIGQFVVGTRFGRHKLAARISPQKTWQGVGGGLVISAVVSVWVGRSLGLASVPWLVGMGLVLCIAGLMGDLLFSAGKRALKIKDYGQLIPGHGGILDRVDSLVLTAPVMLVALRWV